MKKLLAAFVLTAAGSAAALTYCSPDGDDANPGTEAAPKCSIQKVLAAKPNETVYLLSGEYHLQDASQKVEGESGALHVNGSGVLRSSTGNPADVVIDGDGASECIRIAGRYRLEGITFTGGANPSAGARACLISVQSEGNVVSNCVVRDFDMLCSNNVNRIAVGLYQQAKLYDTRFENIRGDAVGVALRAYNGSLVSGCTFDGVCSLERDASSSGAWGEKNVVFTNCVFRNGTGAKAQLRVSGAEGEPCRVVDCTFTNIDLTASACYAAAYSELTRCTFAHCTSAGDGGALWARSCSVQDCSFTENQAADFGGACLVIYDEVVKTATRLRGCSFSANGAGKGGGAVVIGHVHDDQGHVAHGQVDVADCVFASNSCKWVSGNYTGGGAIMVYTGSVSGGLVANSRFIGNTTTGHGGAVNARYHMNSSPDVKPLVLRNCLFADNVAGAGQGGALYIIGQGTAQPGVTNAVENCTLVGNAGSSAANGHGLYQKFGNFRCVNTLFGPSQTIVSGNNPAGNYYQACYFPANPTQSNGSSQLLDCLVGADPKFADADAGDYSLAGGSPCVNKGVLLDWMDDAAVDLAGGARVAPAGGQPDIGCYERFVAGGLRILIR